MNLELTKSPRYSGSLATTRIGKYVSGSATAEKTMEYSVTLMGSTVVSPIATANRIEIRTTAWKRAASAGLWLFPHVQPKYWATVYPAERPVSRAAPKVAAKNPMITTTRP